MSKQNDGGPAFPRPTSETPGMQYRAGEQDGMSLRAFIATEAMSALIIANSRRDGPDMDADEITAEAVAYADGLMEELEK